MFIESITGLSKMILVKGGHGFSNNCRNICVNHFWNVKICQTVLFSVFFPHFAECQRIFMHALQIVLVCFAKLAL
jgi:hypothetical protein